MVLVAEPQCCGSAFAQSSSEIAVGGFEAASKEHIEGNHKCHGNVVDADVKEAEAIYQLPLHPSGAICGTLPFPLHILLVYLALYVVAKTLEGGYPAHLLRLDFKAELLLHNHYNIHKIKAVYLQVLLKVGLRGDLLRLYLENEQYEVVEAEDGRQALSLLREKKPDLCVLDIMMPKMDGYHVLQELRKESNIPVLILSAKDADSEKILGLNLGADDYLSKPFNPLEAVARVNSNIRRFYSLGTQDTVRGEITVRDLTLNSESCTLKKAGQVIDLTSVEYRIMELFMQHPGKVFTKQQIYEQGWGETYIVADNNIMVCISKLRAKLDEDPSAYIRTIRGLGYRLEK